MCLRSLVACVNCDGTLLSTCMKTGSLRSSMPVGQLLDLIRLSALVAGAYMIRYLSNSWI